MSQQPLLAPDASPVTDEFTASSYDSVAGNDDGDRISIISHAYCLEGFWTADALSNVSIISSHTERNLTQFPPGAHLERRSAWIERCFKALQFSSEV